jgi:leader peptidase (prepilin peptidase)/N-methyltransferase
VLVIAVILAAALGLVVGFYAPRISVAVVGLEIPSRPIFYPISTALFAGLTVYAVGTNTLVWAWLAVALVGAVLSFVDLAHHRLPDRLVLILYVAVLVLLLIPAISAGDWSAYLRALFAALAMFAAYFLLALIYPAGMGLGDVKLAGALGLALGFLGWGYVIVGFFAAFFLGSFVGLGLMVLRKANRKTPIPFGPFMIIGAVVAVLLTTPLVDAYSGSLDLSSAPPMVVVKH